jgi:hypothetical protein
MTGGSMKKLVEKVVLVVGFVVIYHVSYALFTVAFHMMGAAS